MVVDIHDTHKDRHGCRNVECKPRPMRSLELVSDLPQDLGGMDRRSFYEHELVAGHLKATENRPSQTIMSTLTKI